MSEPQLIDHLFRHEYGKLVAVLTRIFGLSQLERVEDAVQDTFAKALLAWRNQPPDNPEAWLMRAARNRVVDLIRQGNTAHKHHDAATFEVHPQQVAQLFLDEEIQDSQLRMVFTACHPSLQPADQIAFALKAISGFSQKEIAAALLLKEETIKKRLQRARKQIASSGVAFDVPTGPALQSRLEAVLEVIHLLFNEGFHSTRQDHVIREELCGEALRLCRMVLQREDLRSGPGYGLLALMCFHSARLNSKTAADGTLVSLRDQDRSLWYTPLADMGRAALTKSFDYPDGGAFRIEAAIASQHHAAPSYAQTNWPAVCALSEELTARLPSPMTWLNLAMVHIEAGNATRAKDILTHLDPTALQQRAYLYHGAWAEVHVSFGDHHAALEALDCALNLVHNNAERQFLLSRRGQIN